MQRKDGSDLYRRKGSSLQEFNMNSTNQYDALHYINTTNSISIILATPVIINTAIL